MTSIDAAVADRTSGKCTTATLVGNTGASRIVTEFCRYQFCLNRKIVYNTPSVTIPNVPSAPMKSFVVSKPAEDFRERLLVLMTSPDGSTTVCEGRIKKTYICTTAKPKVSKQRELTALRNHSPFAVPYRTAFARMKPSEMSRLKLSKSSKPNTHYQNTRCLTCHRSSHQDLDQSTSG